MAWFNETRSLAEQMLGIEHALAEAKGATVLDVGCAEGLIGIEFAKAGAKVTAFDNNQTMVDAAQRAGRVVKGFRAKLGDINADFPLSEFDIVLALAVLHKARDVEAASRRVAEAARRLLVIRLQRGSTGEVRAKFGDACCDLRVMLPPMGFYLERELPGPRGERVHYWRRK